MSILSSIFPFLFGFGDNRFSVFGHPHFLARSALRHSISAVASSLHGEMLDVGCGTMPYRHLFNGVNSCRGLEIDQLRNRMNPLVTDFYDGRRFPFKDSTFDVVLCSQVLEHSFNPDELLREIFRVLRPGGILLLTIPFLWPEHEQPFDSQRFTSFGLRHRLKSSGYQEIRISKANPGIAALVQLSIEWMESVVRSFVNQFAHLRVRALLVFVWRFLALPVVLVFNLLGLFARSLHSFFFDIEAADFYLDLIVVAQRPPAR